MKVQWVNLRIRVNWKLCSGFKAKRKTCYWEKKKKEETLGWHGAFSLSEMLVFPWCIVMLADIIVG